MTTRAVVICSERKRNRHQRIGSASKTQMVPRRSFVGLFRHSIRGRRCTVLLGETSQIGPSTLTYRSVLIGLRESERTHLRAALDDQGDRKWAGWRHETPTTYENTITPSDFSGILKRLRIRAENSIERHTVFTQPGAA